MGSIADGAPVPLTYQNPVFNHYMADPYVLLHEGHYYAYGTAPAGTDGLVFPVLHSANLVRWERASWALVPPEGGAEFWAPEVVYSNGLFYMYYSARGIDGQDHRLRVATSARPTGPFVDSGRVLMPDDPFTIDAHPFRDVDGQWYLFYARDFLTLDGDSRVGTGIVVDRLVDMHMLADDSRVVVRPHADWQIFQLARLMYGAVYDWYTVEGAAMRIHNGRYYCFYSGGAWERENYGVAYVVADHPLGPYHRPAAVNGPLLRSAPGHVIGPGHNSFTAAPDGQQEVIVYHAWDAARTARLMRIDRLLWDGDQPIIDGPTYTPQNL